MRRAIQTTLDLGVLVQRGVRLLQQNAPKDGSTYYGAFSGGKDSCCIKELARMAEVPVEWHYHATTIDPPELVRFIRAEHPDVIWDKPRHGNLLHRALTCGFPARRGRWCCKEYKETADTGGRPLILGIRIAESDGRSKHWTACTVPHFRSGVTTVLPIRLWQNSHVWDFIRWRCIPYCSLYDERFDRLGCVGCPLATPGQRAAQFLRWPRFEASWRRMFDRVWAKRANRPQRGGREWFGSREFDSPSELFAWWNDGQHNITEWRAAHGLAPKGEQAALGGGGGKC